MSDKLLSVEYITEVVNSTVTVYKDIKSVILFGSYAKGKATPESDVDLIIELESNFNNEHFFGFWDDMELSLHKEIDLHELEGILSSPYKDSILQGGLKIYEKV